jgi:pimeloyl-ACP methyl ester carboxylesterase
MLTYLPGQHRVDWGVTETCSSAGLEDTVTIDAQRRVFESRHGLRLVADSWGAEHRPVVILLHGGGQTRHSWSSTGETLARLGYCVVSYDARGHGESDWSEESAYTFDDFIEDVEDILAALGADDVILVGASMGGFVALLAEGEGRVDVTAVVLVDIATTVQRSGVERIIDFMTARPEGFADLDEAAEAVRAYLPHRYDKTSRVRGLEKNLRQGPDGRFHWHWDPRFLRTMIDGRSEHQAGVQSRLDRAALGLNVPTLLVRGRQSDVIGREDVERFLELVPHADFVDIAEAGHMVVGDKHDHFTSAIASFVTGHLSGS